MIFFFIVCVVLGVYFCFDLAFFLLLWILEQLKTRFLKSEAKRNALRKAVQLLEGQFNVVQAENLKLKKGTLMSSSFTEVL